MSKAEIRPNVGAVLKKGRCEDTDEVVGDGGLHVEQMAKNGGQVREPGAKQ